MGATRFYSGVCVHAHVHLCTHTCVRTLRAKFQQGAKASLSWAELPNERGPSLIPDTCSPLISTHAL